MILQMMQEMWRRYQRGQETVVDFSMLLNTTTCASLRFVSTQRVAFGSNRPIKTYSTIAKLIKFQCKVSIPLRKI